MQFVVIKAGASIRSFTVGLLLPANVLQGLRFNARLSGAGRQSTSRSSVLNNINIVSRKTPSDIHTYYIHTRLHNRVQSSYTHHWLQKKVYFQTEVWAHIFERYQEDLTKILRNFRKYIIFIFIHHKCWPMVLRNTYLLRSYTLQSLRYFKASSTLATIVAENGDTVA